MNYDSSLFPTLLLVLFIGLKLTNIIDWSWWWVMSPLWIPILIVIFIAVPFYSWIYFRSRK